MCNLCGSHYVTPNWDNVASTSPFMTCRQVYFQLAVIDAYDHRCSPLQQQFNYDCCTSGGGLAYTAPPPPQQNIGNEPTCNICNDGSYPGNPNKFISARYVGSFSCGTLYQRGRNGQIPAFMCGPLQHNLQQSCGCGIYAPPPTPAPVESPTPARRPPTKPPTRPPTRRPTTRPTGRPTTPPTPYPSPQPTKPPTKPPTPQPTRPQPTKPHTEPPTPPPTPVPTEYSALARKEVPQGGEKVALKYSGVYSRNYGQRRGLKETLSQEDPPEESDP